MLDYIGKRKIVYTTVLFVVFFLAIKVGYSAINTLDQTKLLEEMDNISFQQDTFFTDFKRYLQVQPYDCGNNAICEIHTYNAPPYDNTGKGYVLIMKTENSIQRSAIGKLGANQSGYYEIIDNNVATTTPKL